MPLNDFDYIKQKIRRITGRLSSTQLTDPDILDYINSFMIYDLPLYCRFFNSKVKFNMNLTPNVGVYPIDTFKNLYSDFEPPVYIDGYQIQFYQNDESFYQMFSQLKYAANFSTGNGTPGPYNGFYSYTPIQPTTLIISATDATGALITATDNGIGGFVDQNGAIIPGATINYATGVIVGIVFTANVPVGNLINISGNQYIRGRPIAMLYFDGTFFFWPFPDKSYQFTIDAFINPASTTLGGGSLFPELNQWADVIAFGASLKICQDNMDMETYTKTFPFFDNSKRLALRRTMKQLSTQRASTIYGDAEVWPWQNSYPMI